jgi:hypothetical protein
VRLWRATKKILPEFFVNTLSSCPKARVTCVLRSESEGSRSLNPTFPHGDSEFRTDPMAIAAGSSCGRIFSDFMRQPRESGVETASPSAV